jgi:hypothetical protein
MKDCFFAIKTKDGFLWKITAPRGTTLPELMTVILTNGYWMDDHVYIDVTNIATVVPAQENERSGQVKPFTPRVVEPPAEATE